MMILSVIILRMNCRMSRSARERLALCPALAVDLARWEDWGGESVGVARFEEQDGEEAATMFGSFGSMRTKWQVWAGRSGVVIDSDEVRTYRDN